MQPPVFGPPRSEHIGEAIEDVKNVLRQGCSAGCISDLAFIGNASAIYDWVPCRMVDLDAFLFVPALDESVGRWLETSQVQLEGKLNALGIDFEIRIIDGPYKPSISRLIRPVIVAHLGVFTEERYRACTALERWSWRKYECEVDAARLRRMAPPRPTLAEFVDGPRGLCARLSEISTGRVAMTEWTLPYLKPQTFYIEREDPAFQECCFAYAATCARHHARVLGKTEADQLGNEQFFNWYGEEIFSSVTLAEIIHLKKLARDNGFVHDTTHVHALTLEYLKELAAALT